MIKPDIGKWYTLNTHKTNFLFVNSLGKSNWGSSELNGLHVFKATDTVNNWIVVDMSGEDVGQIHLELMTTEDMKKCFKMIFEMRVEFRD